MRWFRILVAGLAAGVFINLSGMALAHLALGRAYVEALIAHLPGPVGPGTFVRHLSTRFLFGILLVLLYAWLRPVLATQQAAVTASAGFLFLAAYLPLALTLNEFGILVGWRLWVALAWSLAEVEGASLIGVFVYASMAGSGP